MSSHPEAFCDRCERPNVWSWHAPSPLWNVVMRHLEWGGCETYSVLCPVCFAELAEAICGGVVWCFKPHEIDVAALYPDPEGRVWDANECLWTSAEAAKEK